MAEFQQAGRGLCPVSDPIGSIEDAAMMGDAIDDLADLTLDMREVVWLADHMGLDDAHWSFRLQYSHWGRMLANWRSTYTPISSGECPLWVESCN